MGIYGVSMGDLWGIIGDLWGASGTYGACSMVLHVLRIASVFFYVWACGAKPMGIYGVAVAAVWDLWG